MSWGGPCGPMQGARPHRKESTPVDHHTFPANIHFIVERYGTDYLATCCRFPTLLSRGDTKLDALRGIRDLVAATLADLHALEQDIKETLMTLNPEVLRATFNVAAAQDGLVSKFYETLFDAHPEVRSLFPAGGMAKQEKMLTSALVSVMDHLDDDAHWLTTTLHGFGAKHVDYGVTAEMYDWVGEALLATLGEALGSLWTADTQDQWTQAYGAIAGLMQEGARSRG